jgi:hypothetical protein
MFLGCKRATTAEKTSTATYTRSHTGKHWPYAELAASSIELLSHLISKGLVTQQLIQLR